MWKTLSVGPYSPVLEIGIPHLWQTNLTTEYEVLNKKVFKWLLKVVVDDRISFSDVGTHGNTHEKRIRSAKLSIIYLFQQFECILTIVLKLKIRSYFGSVAD